jgi:hypothetical protein
MTLLQLPESDDLSTFGATYARSGQPKPDFATWTQTYGAGDHAVLAHRAFCRGFDAVRSDAWETTKRRVLAAPQARARRVAVPA